jgi:hypothetical protein
MAKVHLNPALTQLQGTVDGMVIKHTPHGSVLSRRPDMSRVKWSPAQIAHRKLMKDAATHYRAMMADPGKASQCIVRAKKTGVPVSAMIIGEYLKRARNSAGQP